MDRVTFCKMLAIAKQRSGKTTSDLCYELRKMPTDIRRIERGLSNFRMDRCFNYLEIIGYCIYIERFDGREYHYFDKPEQLSAWLKTDTAGKWQSLQRINNELGYSRGYINRFIDGSSIMSIDTFLSLAEYFSYDIQLLDV